MGDRQDEAARAALLADLTIDRLSDGVAWIDATGRFRRVNAAISRDLGYSEEELLQMSIPDVHRELAPGTWPSFWERIRAAGSSTFETHHLTRSGEEIPVEVNASFMAFDDEEFVCAVIRDLRPREQAKEQLREAYDELERRVEERTAELSEANRRLTCEVDERKQMEAALRASEERYHTLARLSPALIFRADREGRCTYVNERWEELTGAPAVLACGHGWIQAVHPEDRTRVREEMLRSANGNDSSQTEFRLLHVDGTTRWLLSRAHADRGPDGEVLGYVGVVLDITERKEAEEAIRRSEERYRNLYNAAPVMMHSVDPDGYLVSVNDYWLRTLGYTCRDVLGKRWVDFLTEDCRRKVLAHMATERPAPDAIRSGALQMVKQSGEVIDVLLSASAERDGWLAIIVDVTEHRHAEAELRAAKNEAEAASRAKSEFLANISHELRTPLNGILGYAQVLLRDEGLSESQREGVTVIQTSGEHLLTLINDVLDLSKIEAGKVEVADGEVHLATLLRSIVDIAGVKAGDRGLNLHYEPAPDLPHTVRGDEIKLRQVLLNLLGNAVKFTREGSVTFRVGRTDGGLRFDVEDTGIGIEADKLADVFKPFHQLHDGNEPIEGTGLGLPISQRLAEAMGGALTARSEPGTGSVFTVEVPAPEVEGRSDPPPTPTDRRRKVGYEGPRRRILVVDDKPENRAIIANLLGPVGFEVIEAESGAHALALSEREAPDLVLVDLKMPDMDGFETACRLKEREHLRLVPVIAMSASVFEHDRTRSRDAGCDDFLAKPLRAEELMLKVGRHLDISWVCCEGVAPCARAADEPLVAPPAAELRPLLDQARRGHIVEVRRQIRRLAELDPRYRRFAWELGRLAKGFELERICEYLEPHLTAR